MAAIWYRFSAELRARWRAWAALGLLAGLAAGAVIAAAAGARRTETAYSRFLVAQDAADYEVFTAPGFGEIDLDQVVALPQVVVAKRYTYLNSTDPDITTFVPTGDGTVAVDQPKLLAGRMPLPDRPHEVAASFTLARSRSLGPGDSIDIPFVPAVPAQGGAPPPVPDVVTFRVVGVEASPGEFPPRTGTLRHTLHFSRAFLDTDTGKGSKVGEAVRLRLEGGSAGAADFEEGLRRIAGEEPVLSSALSAGAQSANVQRSIRLQAVALWLVAGLVAIVTMLVLSQLVARQSYLESTDQPVLAALGLTRGQLWGVGMGRAVFTGSLAALLAVVVAWSASPLFPLGNARVAEPDPGSSFDAAALVAGAAGTFFLLVALIAAPAWRRALGGARPAAATARARPSRIARTLVAAGFPPPATVGVSMAMDGGRGGGAVPVRTSLAGMVVGIAALVAAMTFGASLTHLLSTPRLYGWSWDMYLESNQYKTYDVAPDLAADPSTEAVAFADSGAPLAVGHLETEGFAIGPLKGLIEPVVIEGRAPQGPDELALGAKTFDALGADIGDRVDVRVTAFDAPPAPKRIVGQVVLPSLGDASRFGVGAFLTLEGLGTLLPAGFDLPQAALLVRLAPGVDEPSTLAWLRDGVGGSYYVLGAQRPGDVENFGQVENLPLILAGLLAALAAATLAHTLVSAVRRRRRALAILKTIGFVVPQVRRVVTWQATTLVCAALLVAVPLGVAAGRWGWTLFAEQLGAVPEAVTPSVALLLLVPAAVVLANLVAVVPAWMAGRAPPALALRAE